MDPYWQLAFPQCICGSHIVSVLRGTTLPVMETVNGQLNPCYQLLVIMTLGNGLKQATHMAFISEQKKSFLHNLASV